MGGRRGLTSLARPSRGPTRPRSPGWGCLHPVRPLGLLGRPPTVCGCAHSASPGDRGAEKLRTSRAGPSTASCLSVGPSTSAELPNSSWQSQTFSSAETLPWEAFSSLKGLWLADRFSTRATSGKGTPVHVTQESVVRAWSSGLTSLLCAHTHQGGKCCLLVRLHALVPAFCCVRPAAAHRACLTALCTLAARCQRSSNSIYFKTTGFIWSFLNTHLNFHRKIFFMVFLHSYFSGSHI